MGVSQWDSLFLLLLEAYILIFEINRIRMKYMGSKRRIVSEILPLMLANRKPGQTFIDAFCGGCHVIEKVPGEYKRIANDNNRYLVAMLEALTETTWSPPTSISRDFYNDVRSSYYADDGRFSDALVGWVGYVASWNGRFFDGGYSGIGKNGRDYVAEQIRNIQAQLPSLKGIEWRYGSYDSIEIPPESLIYCDPPYLGCKTYPTSAHFDYEAFYDWCRDRAAEGHTVFVSEYQMPPDFICLWKKEIVNNLNKKRPTERLYTISRKCSLQALSCEG